VFLVIRWRCFEAGKYVSWVLQSCYPGEVNQWSRYRF